MGQGAEHEGLEWHPVAPEDLAGSLLDTPFGDTVCLVISLPTAHDHQEEGSLLFVTAEPGRGAESAILIPRWPLLSRVSRGDGK